jgi:hypothetical protein
MFEFDAIRQELPEVTQQRCRELVGQMLLAVVTNFNISGERNDEREDSVTPSGSESLRVCAAIDDAPSA